jgi:hypothetical protein
MFHVLHRQIAFARDTYRLARLLLVGRQVVLVYGFSFTGG